MASCLEICLFYLVSLRREHLFFIANMSPLAVIRDSHTFFCTFTWGAASVFWALCLIGY